MFDVPIVSFAIKDIKQGEKLICQKSIKPELFKLFYDKLYYSGILNNVCTLLLKLFRSIGLINRVGILTYLISLSQQLG